MTKKSLVIGDNLSLAGAFALSAAGLYFGTVGAKNQIFIFGAYIAFFLFILIKSWFDKKPFRRWQRFYALLLFILIALFYLVWVAMDPLKSARTWLFGIGWLLPCIYQLYIFYSTEDMPEKQ